MLGGDRAEAAGAAIGGIQAYGIAVSGAVAVAHGEASVRPTFRRLQLAGLTPTKQATSRRT